ncbi:kinase-like domain-containing protein [Powellomyces hirtus]|nr:kinase-like domain-containing protein [Powellomyces hirtus]
MSIVSTPPIASGHEAQDLFGHSAPEPSSFIHHQSVSEREFATNPLHPRFLANYSVKAELGFGATGFVVAAKRIEDGKPVAVKFMYKDRIPVTHWLRDRQLGGTVPLEIFILKRIDHQHIVKFLDFFEDKKFFYLVMETHGIPALLHNHDGGPSFRTSPLSPTTPTTLRLTTHHSTLLLRRPPRRHSQDLFECIEQNPCMAESDIHHIFRQITSAVAYLHAHNIVHRDIKDENIVIDESLTVKLIDFGNAAYIPRNDSDYFDRFYGTMHCAAPEILRGERYRGPEQDVWCLGVLLYTLAFNQTPFRDARDIATGRWTKPIFDRSELLFRVLKMCLEVDIKKRATITEVLESEWVAGCTTRVA